ncbi:hypothetical protein [Shimia thalassica]|uniref:hypothetical protein n=1 Tax=Shimia thalassica TaxID=1715693 RepID=UPI0024943B6E|nr:hypothetical protein [Shimia thalassica]
MKEFKLTSQLDWPKELGSAYSFEVGYEPNKALLAAALTPRTAKGRADLVGRSVLSVLLFRLKTSKIRTQHKADPRFGAYQYSWFHMSDLEMWAGLTEDQATRGMKSLIDGGIVYATRANQNQPRSYRLTDAAFMMAHALEYPQLKLRYVSAWIGTNEKSKNASMQKLTQGMIHVFDEADQSVKDHYIAAFAHRVAEWKPLLDEWHRAPHPSGWRHDPYECGFVSHVEADCAEIFHKVDTVMEAAQPASLDNILA